MRLLLDTHALVWWLIDSDRLSDTARRAIYDGDVLVSAASIWETAMKHRLGKLPSVAALLHDVPGALQSQGFAGMPITLAHAQTAGSLPLLHRDPFDRMLIAQAMLEDLWLVSNERPFDAYGVKRLW